MKINGIELDFDFYDADQMELLEEALDKLGEDIQKALSGESKQSVMIRAICQATINMLDDIFGEGTAKEVFKGETNFKKCIEVFKELVEEREKQESELGEELEKIKGKYEEQPQNRAIRRAARKN